MYSEEEARYAIDAQGDFALSPTRSLPRNIVLRRGRVNDEIPTLEVMRRAMGFSSTADYHIPIRNHLRETPAVSFWLAEETPRFARPRIVGYARSIVRDRVFCLTEFFVLPDYHRRGIGSNLLANCLRDSEPYGVEARMVLASHHVNANALYIRQLGCLPRLPMYLLAGSPNSLELPREQQGTIFDPHFAEPLSDPSRDTLFAEPLLYNSETVRVLNALDRQVIGFAREEEHRFWSARLASDQGVGRLFRRGSDTGEVVGYAYQSYDTQGPILATNPKDLPRLLHHITHLLQYHNRLHSAIALSQGYDSYCAIAGICDPTLSWLLRCGWQITFEYLYFSSRPLGQLDRYIGHNPLYVL
jgi:GNAT superfamily N-acetyltransferase